MGKNNELYELKLDIEDLTRSMEALTCASLDLIPKRKHNKLFKKFLKYRRLYDALYDAKANKAR